MFSLLNNNVAKFDVVKNYDWTSIPRGSGLRKSAPRVWVKSFKINSNEALNRLKSYLNAAAVQSPKTFYEKLYSNAQEEDDFNFPYFADGIRSFSNTFGDTFQNGFGGGGGIGGGLDTLIQTGLGIGGQVGAMMGTDALQSGMDTANRAKESGASVTDSMMAGLGAFLGNPGKGSNPGSYIETPKMYQYEMNDSALEVSFALSNTINADYQKNTELVKKLTTINRPKRINSIAMEPPRIYQVKIPGQRFIKWAYCSSFSTSMLGTKREIGGVITPEGYMVSMSFTSLTTEVSNFMDDV
jgi:hypothetical protein